MCVNGDLGCGGCGEVGRKTGGSGGEGGRAATFQHRPLLLPIYKIEF